MLYVVGKEMKKEYIIDNIEKLINGEICEFQICEEVSSTVDSFMENTTIRLINTYKKYQVGECGKSDYLVSLRNFMIVFQAKLRIKDTNIIENNHFGIHKDSSGFRYYATYDIPKYIKYELFVKDAFISFGTQEAKRESRYSLRTNGYVKELTGFDFFKSIEQKLCVYGALNTPAGYTTLVSMPTGGGKSLITQAVGYANEGLSIVVVPTVSLAIDQERVAKSTLKIKSDNEIFYYDSKKNNIAQISDAILKKKAKLLFISPEALIKNDQFRKLLQQANKNRYINNLIIDEAHIVVAWGDFFRVDYQCLGPWRSDLLKVNPDIRTFLLSATFQDDTVTTLKKIFVNDEKWIEIRCDSLRKEPRYIMIKADGYCDKCSRVLELVNKLPHPMILYVNAPYAAKKWKEYLEKYGYNNIKTFTGETKSEERKTLIDEWAKNKYDLMIATAAFGVGVDKPDVRSVIHLYMPENPDTYYQELGRGGRDGLPCLSVMCIDKADIVSGYKNVSKVLTTEKLCGRWWSMFTNNKNQWQNGLIAILASTKPNYSKTNYFEEGNDTDEKWNINVLLLLNRYEQIKIVALDLDQHNRYIFTVKILNDQITSNTDENKKLFDSIREDELLKSKKAIDLIKKAIENDAKECWSTMFYDTYSLVSEYCPGCNQHCNRVADELNRFPLLVDVKGPEKNLLMSMKDFFSNTNEVLIISKQKKMELIEKYLPDVVVCENIENIENIEKIQRPGINYMNFAEFRVLQMSNNFFYISGLVLVIYSEDQDKALSEYNTIVKYLDKDRYVIHVSKFDFCISKSSSKKISDRIDGIVIR